MFAISTAGSKIGLLRVDRGAKMFAAVKVRKRNWLPQRGAVSGRPHSWFRPIGDLMQSLLLSESLMVEEI
jgi:hypothetical protein